MKRRTMFVALGVLLSASVYANTGESEPINGFTPKQSEVVIKAFDILTAQMWDQVTDDQLVTLSQAAAIAMDSKNPHYSPKAAFAFMTRILEVQYDYRPLNELTQKVFKSAVLSLMRGDYRFANESERVLRNKHEFRSDLRQMREMLKKAKLVEKRKANECLFVNTLAPLIMGLKPEMVAKLREGQACSEPVGQPIRNFCDTAYHDVSFCVRKLSAIAGDEECHGAKTQIAKTVLNPPACANPIEIAAKLNADAAYITVEQIEKTLLNEDTELAFNMGLAVTDPATQKTYHLIRDRFEAKSKTQNVVEDDEFDLDGPRHSGIIITPAIEAPKTKREELAEFSADMSGPRFKTAGDAIAQKPLLLEAAASTPVKTAEPKTAEAQAEPQPEAPKAEPKAGFWNWVSGALFGR